MVAIFMAPISADIKINDKNLAVSVERNKVMAASIEDLFSASKIFNVTANSNSVSFNAQIILSQEYSETGSDTKILEYYDNVAGGPENPERGILFTIKNSATGKEQELYWTSFNLPFDTTKTTNALSANSGGILAPNTNYTISLTIKSTVYANWTSNPIQFTTTATGTASTAGTNAFGATTSSGFGSGYSLGCGITSLDGIIGCVAGLFYMLWGVSAEIARLAGSFLDFFVYYSTNSSSYANDFVKQAWAAVRDIANIFFIVALLYVAIKTILGLNVTDNKKLIGAVIVVALIINFSLFTTKVVIDGSNMLAKVFYNNITSVDTSNEASLAGAGGQKSISIGIIRGYNPQEIITTPQEYSSNQGTFIFITILALVVTLFTAYIFFSVALLFVARVVSLWIAMIFSPLAFASYTVPFEVPGFGHKEWWSDLLKNAFLAPIFIFFLYIIILFTGFLKNITIYPTGSDTIQHIMGVVIPFAIILMLLLKAKTLAVKYSGEMGAGIVKAGAVLGGLAVGGAALGIAAAGRGTVGAVSKYVPNDAARTKDFKTFGDYKNWSLGKKINPFAYAAQAGKTATAAAAAGFHGIGLGKKMQEADRGFAQKTHATSILDQKAKSEFGHQPGYENVKYKDLTEVEQGKVNKQVDLDAMAKFKYGKQFKDLEAPEAMEVKDRYERTNERPIAGPNGEITDVRIAGAGDKIMSAAFVEQSKVNAAMGEFVQALRKGSYDVRKLPDMSAKSKGFFPKLVVGVSAAVATGMRAGLKTSFGANAGTPQKDFFKDLGNIISESLKSVKIDIGGEHGSGDNHPKEVKSVGH